MSTMKLTEKAQEALTRGHGITPQDPDNAYDSGGNEAHHDHVEGGLRPGHAAVEQAQPGGHEQRHCRRDHQPDMLRSEMHRRPFPLIQISGTSARAIPLINRRGAVFRSVPQHVACLLRNGPLRENHVTGMFRAG